MTFEDWWETKPMTFKPTTKAAAKLAWDRATAAERKRCRKIAEKHAKKGLGTAFRTADTIADEIGE